MGPPFSPETPGGVEPHWFGVGGLAAPPPLFIPAREETLRGQASCR